jgi:hypothetical protein
VCRVNSYLCVCDAFLCVYARTRVARGARALSLSLSLSLVLTHSLSRSLARALSRALYPLASAPHVLYPAHICIRARAQTHTLTHTHTHTHTQVYIYIFVHTHKVTTTYTHLSIHTYIHTCVCVCVCVCVLARAAGDGEGKGKHGVHQLRRARSACALHHSGADVQKTELRPYASCQSAYARACCPQ